MSVNIPSTFLEKIETQFPHRKDAFLRSFSESKNTSIRWNTSKIGSIDNAHSSVPWYKGASILKTRPIFTLDPLFHAGCYYVQEASSMLLQSFLDKYLNISSNPIVLDLCAAPGGKSTLIANHLAGNGTLISNEVIRNRAYILKENIERWGAKNVIVTNADPKHLAKAKVAVDCIVVDAPCSGEGLFRKDENAINEWSEDHVRHCSARQKRILHDAWALLKPGGILIYSTCTYNNHENISNLDYVMSEYEGIRLSIPIEKEWEIETIEHNKSIGYQVFPNEYGGEGFFIGGIQKPGISETNVVKEVNKNIDFEFVKPTQDDCFISFMEDLYLVNPSTYQFYTQYAKRLRLVHLGVNVGKQKKTIHLPSHGLAMSLWIQKEIPEIELNYHDSIMYLQKKVFTIPSNQKGWHMITYKSKGLGLIKHLGNRWNNYLPDKYKIKMEVPKDYKYSSLIS